MPSPVLGALVEMLALTGLAIASVVAIYLLWQLHPGDVTVEVWDEEHPEDPETDAVPIPDDGGE